MLKLLAADIGATNSRFALFSLQRRPSGGAALTLRREIRLAGREYPSFEHVLRALLAGPEPFLQAGEADTAVLALAGPIEDDSCRLSNLPWLIRSREVRNLLGLSRVLLINDFTAQAQYCLFPEISMAAAIQKGSPRPDYPSAVIGAGTGLGKALLLYPVNMAPAAKALSAKASGPAGRTRETSLKDGESRSLQASFLAEAPAFRILASEGGHAEFPFLAEEEGFAAFLSRETGRERLIGDMVVSGSGLGHLHAYLTGKRLADEEASQDAGKHPEILELFARFYARACRCFVLETLALGGLFISGGLALRLPVLSHPAFLAEFGRSAAHQGLLESLPIIHLQDPGSGLWGAALRGVLSLSANFPQLARK
jgi:glucokinase